MRFFAALRMTNPKIIALYMVTMLACASAHAQRPIGTVSTADANVGGVLETSGGTATIVNNGTVTAKERTAVVTLARGGKVNVCATSVVHLSQSTAVAGGPLLVALDRGALEMSFLAASGDALLTPDMRMQPAAPGPLDLRVRVVSNGDTCVENHGSEAPALMISDTFGESSYIVHAGQRVLFEHGSLKQVVDSESSPCGCPPAVVISVAEGGVSGGLVAKPDAHPFPAAVSEGLAPAQGPPAEVAGQTQMQVTIPVVYNGSKDPAAQRADAAARAESTSTAAAGALVTAANSVAQMDAPAAAQPVVAQEPPQPKPPTDDLAHAVVRFYRWLFHRKS